MKKMFYKPQEIVQEEVPKPTELLRFVKTIPNLLRKGKETALFVLSGA